MFWGFVILYEEGFRTPLPVPPMSEMLLLKYVALIPKEFRVITLSLKTAAGLTFTRYWVSV